ncbi:MAG: DUF362 domain-containing protein [Acidobacteria bacterium]|nr:DUF362 domain-containing protein [Acidobacteriota bacterium]
MHLTRRHLLQGAVAAPFLRQLAMSAQFSSNVAPNKLGMPGLFPGKVIGVEDRRSIVSGRYNADVIQPMMRRGMKELTGADWADGWKLFFSRGDRVGIKVNPVGQPHVISAPEVLHQIIDGLRAAGVRPQDIVVYDRYRAQFHRAGFHTWLPEGVRKSNAVEEYENIQLDSNGYDRDHWIEMALTHPGYDKDERARKSFAASFITKEVDKLINLCVLKDHQSAGVTLALKNLSHGLVNNVSRSHATRSLNACNAFIPAVVALPTIRYKAVLHVLDGVKGVYHGGPSARPQFVWEHHTLYFATDPVALDHVGWRRIDEKRVAVGKKKLVEDTPDEFSTFIHRQPEHVEIAGGLGLGVWDWDKIRYQHIRLDS